MDERDPMSANDRELLDIERALMDGLDDDPRLGNGVPSHLRGSDLDFIQMTGLTVSSGVEESVAFDPDPDLDPSMPVSFYEEGVDDVDGRRAPLGTEPEAGSADDVLVRRPATAMSSSIESLKEIVADLTGRESRARDRDAGGALRESVPEPLPLEPVEESDPPFDEPEYFDDIVVPDDEPEITEPSGSRSPLSRLGALPEEEPSGLEPIDEPVVDELIEPVGNGPIQPEPVASRETPGMLPRRPDLAQAESLLQRLEAQTEDRAAPVDDDFEMPEIPEPAVHDRESAETDESVYNRPNAPARGHGRRRRTRRRLLRWFAILAALAALGLAAYYAYGIVRQQTATEADVYRAAMRLAERERHAEAGVAFSAFSSRYPDSALGGDAILMAARSYERAGDAAAAIQHYDLFRAEYANHPKIHRATTLLALALVRDAQYEKAITLLQEPERRTLDPDGYLASLRALGKAHAALGQIDEARSAYLRAASLEGNYTADEDYLALAALYQTEADAAEDPETRRRYLSLAVDQWDFAMRSPGITESRRREIKARRDLIINELSSAAFGSLPGPAPAAPDAAELESSVGIKPEDAAADDTSANLSPPGVGVPEAPPAEVPGTARDYEAAQTQLTHVD